MLIFLFWALQTVVIIELQPFFILAELPHVLRAAAQ
jgi:hypothetical protein